MVRTTWVIDVVLLCTLVLVTACQPPSNIPPTPPEQPVTGQSGPKRGEKLPQPDLPKKDRGVELPPINPEGASKLPSAEVVPIEPGTSYTRGDRLAKAPPRDEQGITGEVPKKAKPERSRARHGRVQFKISREGEIVPETGVIIPGELVPLTTIDGELFYVFTVNSKPVHVGSFRDPLYMVGLPRTRGQGYSRVELDEGTFTVAIPGALLEPRYLTASVLKFYRLGPGIPYDTPLTLRTVKDLIGASKLLGVVRGSRLAEVLREQQ